MGFIKNSLRESRSAGIPIDNIKSPTNWLKDLMQSNRSKSGLPVSEETAIQVMAVFVCVNLISNIIACLPKPVYKNDKKARDHPLWNRLNYAANPEMTAFDFWKCMMVNVLLSKGGFAEVVRDGTGTVTELWPIPGKYVTIYRNSKTDELYLSVYVPDPNGGKGRYCNLYPGQYFYIKGFTKDGINGYMPVNIAREAIGLSGALEQFGSEFFANGANAGGIVEYPEGLSDPAFERYKKSFRDEYTGLGKQNRLIFLEQGAKYTQLTVPPNAGQFLESRKNQVIEICRFFSVPPHKAFEYGGITYNTAEQGNIEFTQTTITPWCVNIDQAAWLYLLLPNEQKKMYIKNNINGLLRGDFQTRMQSYHWMRQDGVFSANMILELEDMDPIPEELGGDMLVCNGNMIPLNMAGLYQKQKGGNNNAGQKETGNPGKGATEQ